MTTKEWYTYEGSKRAGIMLAVPFEQRRMERWNPPYLVQPKLDGERCRAVITDSNPILYTSEVNEFVSVPHINMELKSYNLGNIELDGELYVHGMDFNDIQSIVSRTTNLHPDFEDMEYHIFDIVSDKPQLQRLLDLQSLKEYISYSDNIKIVDCYLIETFDELMQLYDQFRQLGYEGFIIRNVDMPYVRKRLSNYMMKYKPKKRDIYPIISWKEEKDKYGNPKGRMGALVCTSDEGTVFSVGSGMTDEDRNYLWKIRDSLPGKRVLVSYQHVFPKTKAPRFGTFLKIMP